MLVAYCERDLAALVDEGGCCFGLDECEAAAEFVRALKAQGENHRAGLVDISGAAAPILFCIGKTDRREPLGEIAYERPGWKAIKVNDDLPSAINKPNLVLLMHSV